MLPQEKIKEIIYYMIDKDIDGPNNSVSVNTHYSNVVLISDPSLSPMTYSNASMFGVDE